MEPISGRVVLACVDLAGPHGAVLACARGLAASDGRLVILHVAAPEPDFVGYDKPPSTVRDSVARHLRAEHQAVQRLADDVGAPGLNVTPLTVEGPTVERILEHADRLNAAFIVVASRGHGALHELFAGSVVRGVLRSAKVPVVVVPPSAESD